MESKFLIWQHTYVDYLEQKEDGQSTPHPDNDAEWFKKREFHLGTIDFTTENAQAFFYGFCYGYNFLADQISNTDRPEMFFNY